MPPRNIDPTTATEIGARLKMSRHALGYTQATMARLMGSATAGQAWENYEAGRRRISIDHALMLTRTCRLTLSWIYQGEIDSLPPDIRDKIIRLLPVDVSRQHTRRKSGISGK